MDDGVVMARLLAVVDAARALERCPECGIKRLDCGHAEDLHNALVALDERAEIRVRAVIPEGTRRLIRVLDNFEELYGALQALHISDLDKLRTQWEEVLPESRGRMLEALHFLIGALER